MFKTKKINDKEVYYSSELKIEHFFTSRNLVVKNNIDLIKNYLKVDNLIHPKQVHSANIEVVEEGRFDYINCDSLILSKKNIGIFLNFADCTPLIFYDEKKDVASIAHAGWRGTAAKIGPKTVLKMKEIFNCNPKDITALIGPCISFSCFETSDEALFELKKTVDKKEFFSGNFADLKGINKRQLELVGVEKIDVCPFCTVLDNDKFFSYRKENKTDLRYSAVLKL